MKLGPVQVGEGLSIILLPWALLALFLAGALSIPTSAITWSFFRFREWRFARQMNRLGRTISWSGFMDEVERDAGTLILESFSMKGPTRWWWTPERVITEMLGSGAFDCSLRELKEQWHAVDRTIREGFTGVEGTARLVMSTREQRGSVGQDQKLPERWARAYVGPSLMRYMMEFPEGRTTAGE